MRPLLLLVLTLVLTAPVGAQDLRLPLKDGSTRFAVIGDTGTGGSQQVAVGQQLMAWRSRFPFELILMVGDNLYGSERPGDYVKKFERPYKSLLDSGVKFYAALGNHDEPTQRLYKPFNMNGERYYSFKPSVLGGVRFFALDSNYMDQAQLDWLKKELAASGSEWKIPFFHHPLYSSSRKREPNSVLREQLEPIFVEQGVNVVFMGHEHFYERIKPQKGIAYFIAGSSAKLRPGDIDAGTGLTIKGFDRGYAFATGYLGLGLLAVTLLLGPANLVLRRRNPVSTYLRRDVGIWTAFFSVLHVVCAVLIHASHGSGVVALCTSSSPRTVGR